MLEQLDLLGEILPELRKGFAEGRPAHIPDAPTHASLVAARDADCVSRRRSTDATGREVRGRRHRRVAVRHRRGGVR